MPRGVVEETLRAPFFADVFFDLAEIFLAAMASSRFLSSGVTMTSGSRHHAMATGVPVAKIPPDIVEALAPQSRGRLRAPSGARSEVRNFRIHADSNPEFHPNRAAERPKEIP